MIKLLIEKGCDINLKNAVGRTPLHIAVERGYIEIVKLLDDSEIR